MKRKIRKQVDNVEKLDNVKSIQKKKSAGEKLNFAENNILNIFNKKEAAKKKVGSHA